MYISKKDEILHGWLKMAFRKKRNIRELKPSEFGLVVGIREIKKAANTCITEMLFIKRVIEKLNIKDLFWVKQNFERMIYSMHKQRDLISAVGKAFSCYKPKDEEMEVISYFIDTIKKRIEYLFSIPIPENIKLTPIQDYIEFIGADNFMDELREEFPHTYELYNSKDNGRMDDYIEKMLDVLRKAGRTEDYKVRLNHYIEISKKREEARKREQEEEKREKAISEAKTGILIFRQNFYKGIATLEGNDIIGMSRKSVKHQLDLGNRGKYCILCCGYYNGRILYRFVKKDLSLVKSFQSVAVYKTITEAKRTVIRLSKAYPDKVFDAVAI